MDLAVLHAEPQVHIPHILSHSKPPPRPGTPRHLGTQTPLYSLLLRLLLALAAAPIIPPTPPLGRRNSLSRPSLVGAPATPPTHPTSASDAVAVQITPTIKRLMISLLRQRVVGGIRCGLWRTRPTLPRRNPARVGLRLDCTTRCTQAARGTSTVRKIDVSAPASRYREKDATRPPLCGRRAQRRPVPPPQYMDRQMQNILI
ncbi:hypothetical protein C8R44DRAFT_866216 [Mycena epipterygia]|nr:hypothetical protein C8R44DRAFT_866216 [Mycena epipterygia]